MKMVAENKKINDINSRNIVKKEHSYVSNPNMESIPHNKRQVEVQQKSEVLTAWQEEQALADFRW